MNKNTSILQKAFQPLQLDAEKHHLFFEQWEEIEVPRHSFLTEAGSTERWFYVVLEGIQTIYIIDQKGDQKVIGFSFDGSFSGVYDSFVQQKPSAYFLETLTPSRLLRIGLNHYNSWFENYPEFERWGRIVHLELLVGRVQREVELTTSTAKERFESFVNRCPEPLKTIPQKYLASYLNMTPETYSRMRKNRM